MLKLFVNIQSFAVEAAHALRQREEGQTMAEYAVILAVITVAIIAALAALSGGIAGAIDKVVQVLNPA